MSECHGNVQGELRQNAGVVRRLVPQGATGSERLYVRGRYCRYVLAGTCEGDSHNP